MIKARYKILSASMLAAACMGCQRPVYTLHAVGHLPNGITYDHDWQFIVASHFYGLEQYSYWVDADGVNIIDPGHEREKGGTQRTYTVIYFHDRGHIVHAHAWSIIALGITALGLGLWTTVVAVNGITQKPLGSDTDSAKTPAPKAR